MEPGALLPLEKLRRRILHRTCLLATGLRLGTKAWNTQAIPQREKKKFLRAKHALTQCSQSSIENEIQIKWLLFILRIIRYFGIGFFLSIKKRCCFGGRVCFKQGVSVYLVVNHFLKVSFERRRNVPLWIFSCDSEYVVTKGAEEISLWSWILEISPQSKKVVDLCAKKKRDIFIYLLFIYWYPKPIWIFAYLVNR